MRIPGFVICCLLATLSGCDRFYVASFEIENQNDKEIQVHFKNYSVPGKSVPDSTFNITPGNKVMVYLHQSLSSSNDRYIQSGKLTFSSEIKLSSEQVESKRDVRAVSEWDHQRIDATNEAYTLHVTSKDF